MLQGKKILLGVCGSIAAYKAALLVRLLIKAEAEVQVIMTTSASSFISPLTLSTLSKKPVLTKFAKNDSGEWNNHVELGLWADIMLIAPASANTISKMANGLCDNLLLATYLSAKCPVMVAPAMDLDMYRHPSTVRNLQQLQNYGNTIIEAAEGELASGLFGVGRMAEPEQLVEKLKDFFTPGADRTQTLAGARVLITAGPTYEAIDPVRFIGNHSSGKMGFALAEAAASQGATVTIVSGPSQLTPEHASIKVEHVTSANEMFEKTKSHFDGHEIVIFAAAVADYTPETTAKNKIKSSDQSRVITLKKTIDIAATLSAEKQQHQFVVGFALETENEEINAQEKLKKKNLDLIVLNSLNDTGAGFSHDTNKVTLIDRDNNKQTFELKNKKDVAIDIIKAISRKKKYE